MDAVAVDDDRTGPHFVELDALHDGAAKRHGPRRFAARADDGRAPFLQREDAEQLDVLVRGALELAACSTETGVRTAAAGNGPPRSAVSVTTQ
jgi:hypothetical protein